MTTTIEQMVIQLQQELFTLKAQSAARVQMAAAVQVVNHLTTAQVRKDAHSKAAVQMTEISTEFMDRDQDEPGTRSTRPGVHPAAEAHRAYGCHDWRSEGHCCQLAEEPLGDMRSERHCCQLAEEPLGDVAATAEEACFHSRRKEDKLSSKHFISSLRSFFSCGLLSGSCFCASFVLSQTSGRLRCRCFARPLQ